MIKHLHKSSIFSNWGRVREIIFLFLLFSYILLRLYNIGYMTWPQTSVETDIFINEFEKYCFPLILIVLYICNLGIDDKYFEIKIELVKYIIFILFTLISVVHISCLVLGTFILCSDFSSIKNISKVSAAAIMVGTLFVVVSSQMGMAINLSVEHLGRIGYYFGFGHYALWARQILFASIFYFVSKEKKITILELVLFTIIQTVVFYYSTQRLTFVISILTVVVFIVFVKYEFVKINSKIMSILSAISFPVAMAGTLWISLIYEETNIILAKFNSILSGRFMLQKWAFDLFEIPLLFGQQIHQVTDFYFYIDNGYLYALFAYGIVLTTVLIVACSYVIWMASKTNNTQLFSAMTTVLIYLLVDNPICDMTCIGVVFLFLPVLIKEHLTKKLI